MAVTERPKRTNSG